MAHELRQFERSRQFVSWLECFGWALVGRCKDALGEQKAQQLAQLVAPRLAIAHKMPFGDDTKEFYTVWGLFSDLVDAHCEIYLAEKAKKTN